MFIFNYINRNLDKALINDPDPLNKVRARFLVYAFSVSLLVLFITLPTLITPSFSLLFFRSIIIIFLQIGLLWVLLYTSKWKLVAHFACLIVAAILWSNIFVQVEGVKIISMQFILLLIVMSYYLLGNRWGIFYSFISVLFILLNFVFLDQSSIVVASHQLETNNFTFLFVFIFNFALIIYLQYHFFNAFNGTIKQLKTKQQEEELLNEKLKEAIIAAEQSATVKTNFLSTISHELRTPLNGVIGMSNLLILDNPRPDQAENLNILKFSANNLLSLINDVLDISKIESGKIELEHIPFKIHELIEHIYNGFKNRATEKGLDFTLNLSHNLKEIGLIGDPTRLTQIMTNLIENALKFTKKGGINISIQAKEKEGERIKLYFCISDTGIGIPKEKQGLIFESFAQASTSTTRTYGGSGLGLAIVRNLLELHHSKIITQSELNVGTSFTFEIVYQTFDFSLASLIQPEKDIEAIDISNLKILVAEDNKMNTLLMQKLLAKWNVVPHFAENGADAIEAFKANHYDLILMDIHMPVMDGYEASSRIRSFNDEQKAQTPIIALTASVALGVREKIVAAGITDYISKPFKPEELRAKLEHISSLKN